MNNGMYGEAIRSSLAHTKVGEETGRDSELPREFRWVGGGSGRDQVHRGDTQSPR